MRKKKGRTKLWKRERMQIQGKKLRNRQKVRNKLNRIKEIKYRRNK